MTDPIVERIRKVGRNNAYIQYRPAACGARSTGLGRDAWFVMDGATHLWFAPGPRGAAAVGSCLRGQCEIQHRYCWSNRSLLRRRLLWADCLGERAMHLASELRRIEPTSTGLKYSTTTVPSLPRCSTGSSTMQRLSSLKAKASA